MPNQRLLSITLALAALAVISGCPSATSPATGASPAVTTSPELSPSPSMEPTPAPVESTEPTPTPSPTATPSPTPSPSPSAEANPTVSFKDGELSPANVVVTSIGAVTWENDDTGETHAVVPVEIGDFRGTGEIEPGGKSRAVQFNGPGIKKYFCTKHPDEQGSVTVVKP